MCRGVGLRVYAARNKSLTVGDMHFSAPESHQNLLDGIHREMPNLERVLDGVNDEWVHEDLVYRFWHQSFKVYALQPVTLSIVDALRACAPELGLCAWFEQIVLSGTGKTFEMSHNDDWLAHAKPIVDAFFHARFMLGMAVKYGHELEQAPGLLPSGWAALLELFQIR